jgi:hypothetical protein
VVLRRANEEDVILVLDGSLDAARDAYVERVLLNSQMRPILRMNAEESGESLMVDLNRELEASHADDGSFEEIAVLVECA